MFDIKIKIVVLIYHDQAKTAFLNYDKGNLNLKNSHQMNISSLRFFYIIAIGLRCLLMKHESVIPASSDFDQNRHVKASGIITV